MKVKYLKKSGKILIILALVLGLAIPYGAATTNSSTMKCYDSISGLGTFYEINTDKANDEGILTLTKPDESKAIFVIETDSFGTAYEDIDEFHLEEAGKYTLTYKNINYSEYLSCGFEVYAGDADLENSEIDIEGSSVAVADNEDSIDIKMTIRDENKNPVPNYKLTLIPSRESDTIEMDNFATDAEGEIIAKLKSNKTGRSYVSIYDPIKEDIFSNRIKAIFVDDTKSSLLEIGGNFGYASFFDMARAAQDFGPISGFKIDTGEATVIAGEAISVEITAIDDDKSTVLNYLGEITPSTSDDLATIPEPYQFKEVDAGTHTFELSFVFLTPGLQTLSINDTEDFDIRSEIEFEVIEKGGSTSSIDNEDEIEEPQSNIILTSPTAGTYSGNLTFSGASNANSKIQIYANNNLIEQINSDENGKFSKLVDSLENGLYTIYVQTIDNAGKVLAQSGELSLKIDSSAATIESIEIDPEQVYSENNFFVTLFSEAYLAQVSVVMDDKIIDLNEDSGHTGQYSAKITAPKTPGIYQLELILVDQLGQEAIYSDAASLTVKEEEIAEEETVADPEQLEKINSNEIPEETIVEEPIEETVIYPSQVTGFSIVDISANRLDFEWEVANSGKDDSYIKNYRIYYSDDPSNLNTIVNTFDSSTRWYIPNLQSGKTYFFQITAINSKGNESEIPSTILSASPAAAETEEVHESAPEQEPEINIEDKIDETAQSGPSIIFVLLTTLILTDIYIRAKRRLCKNR